MASSKRERELARQRAARQAARRAERERRRRQRNAVVASVLAVLLVGGAAVATTVATQSDDDTASADPTPSASATSTGDPTASATPVQAGDCTYTPSDEPARPVELPGTDVDDETPYTAVVTTDQGELSFELFTADAPCTVHSFRSLAAQDYFSDTPCHRLTDRGIFVLQCGDPSGTGRGGPGYSFADENLQGATYERGVVAMANSGPNTNGSQFFLVYDDSSLPPQYTPFGRLTEEGLKTLDTIAEAGAQEPDETGNTAPVTPVQIESVEVRPTG
ncbi:MAG TPA: peptidylprolyl isomerase [Mycobacteriales bacterium]|nr:peptidylprolyl isomerase [Mycobacteriales bacterium]